MGDMMIPFIMLLIVTIALLLERKHHEDKIVDIYEKKFDEWKEHASDGEVKEQEPCKELVGLVYMQGLKVSIEPLDKKVVDPLERKKFTIKES
jgi:hypothetical protein